MTFEEIKNISDDEFINILKKYIPKEVIDEIYNDKLSKYNKKAYIASILVLSSLLGTISIETLELLLKESISLGLTGGMLLGSIVLSYITINKFKKKILGKRKDAFNNAIIQLKENISNLTKEEFNILISNYECILDNNLDSNINSNVLEVINKLVSINAANILKEFVIENDESKLSICYIDEKDNLDKTYIKGN